MKKPIIKRYAGRWCVFLPQVGGWYQWNWQETRAIHAAERWCNNANTKEAFERGLLPAS